MAFADLVKTFLVINGTRTFISMYTETVYLTCYEVRSILSTNSLHRLFVLNGIMQYTCSGLQGELFFQTFRTRVTSIKLNKNLFRYLPSRHWGTYRYSSTGGGWSPSHSRRFTLGEETRYPLYRRLGGYQGLSGWFREVSHLRGSIPQSIQPATSRYTDCTTPAAIALCCVVLLVTSTSNCLTSNT